MLMCTIQNGYNNTQIAHDTTWVGPNKVRDGVGPPCQRIVSRQGCLPGVGRAASPESGASRSRMGNDSVWQAMHSRDQYRIDRSKTRPGDYSILCCLVIKTGHEYQEAVSGLKCRASSVTCLYCQSDQVLSFLRYSVKPIAFFWITTP